jgi:hypothetical protein
MPSAKRSQNKVKPTQSPRYQTGAWDCNFLRRLVLKNMSMDFWLIPISQMGIALRSSKLRGRCQQDTLADGIGERRTADFVLSKTMKSLYRLETKPRRQGRRGRKHSAKISFARLQGEIPCPQCRLRAETFGQHCRKVCANILTTLSRGSDKTFPAPLVGAMYDTF